MTRARPHTQNWRRTKKFVYARKWPFPSYKKMGPTASTSLRAEYLLADKAYDTNAIIATVREWGMDPVIPPKSNRREKRGYDRALYKLRHLVENGFLDFKQWRGIATHYAKRTASYLAACQLRAVMTWSKLF